MKRTLKGTMVQKRYTKKSFLTKKDNYHSKISGVLFYSSIFHNEAGDLKGSLINKLYFLVKDEESFKTVIVGYAQSPTFLYYLINHLHVL